MMNEFVSTPGLWTWQALCRATGNPVAPGPEIQRVVVDSRQARPGDLFVALSGDPGDKFNPSYRSAVDGHDFVDSAAAGGALGAMVRSGTNAAVPVLEVDDTYDGLWALARAGRRRLTYPAIAVTGSSGKTTAKLFLTEALNAYGPPGSFNNHIGVPLALANALPDYAAGVFEVGTNHPGEIEPLARLVEPDLAILLNVHRAHIENFDNREHLIREKTSIFNALKDKSKAISEDNLQLDFGVKFGFSHGVEAQILDYVEQAGTTTVRVRLFGEDVTARVPGGGRHRASSVAATLLACKLLDMDLTPALSLSDQTVPAGRGNHLVSHGVTVIDESYNANPESMSATLDSYARLSLKGSKIVVLGEMLELGEHSEAAHLALLPALGPYTVFCVGQGTRSLADQLKAPWFAQADESLEQTLMSVITPGDGILIKGSNRVFWAHNFVQRLLAQITRKFE